MSYNKALQMDPHASRLVHPVTQTGRVKQFIKLNSVGNRHLPKAKRGFLAFNLLFDLNGV